MKITLLIATLVNFLYHDVFNYTRPIDIDLHFPVKDYVPQYTHYVRYGGHKRHHFNVTNMIETGNALDKLSSFLIFSVIFIKMVFIH